MELNVNIFLDDCIMDDDVPNSAVDLLNKDRVRCCCHHVEQFNNIDLNLVPQEISSNRASSRRGEVSAKATLQQETHHEGGIQGYTAKGCAEGKSTWNEFFKEATKIVIISLSDLSQQDRRNQYSKNPRAN